MYIRIIVTNSGMKDLLEMKMQTPCAKLVESYRKKTFNGNIIEKMIVRLYGDFHRVFLYNFKYVINYLLFI